MKEKCKNCKKLEELLLKSMANTAYASRILAKYQKSHQEEREFLEKVQKDIKSLTQ